MRHSKGVKEYEILRTGTADTRSIDQRPENQSYLVLLEVRIGPGRMDLPRRDTLSCGLTLDHPTENASQVRHDALDCCLLAELVVG